MGKEDLQIRRGLVIPAAELSEAVSRSSGPGGQHVNKTSTRVSLRWNVRNSEALGEIQRARLLERLESRITRTGDLVVHAERFRSQARNRELAREILASLVNGALRVPRSRVATKPSRGSKQRVLEAKKQRSQLKKARSRPRDTD